MSSPFKYSKKSERLAGEIMKRSKGFSVSVKATRELKEMMLAEKVTQQEASEIIILSGMKVRWSDLLEILPSPSPKPSRTPTTHKSRAPASAKRSPSSPSSILFDSPHSPAVPGPPINSVCLYTFEKDNRGQKMVYAVEYKKVPKPLRNSADKIHQKWGFLASRPFSNEAETPLKVLAESVAEHSYLMYKFDQRNIKEQFIFRQSGVTFYCYLIRLTKTGRTTLSGMPNYVSDTWRDSILASNWQGLRLRVAGKSVKGCPLTGKTGKFITEYLKHTKSSSAASWRPPTKKPATKSRPTRVTRTSGQVDDGWTTVRTTRSKTDRRGTTGTRSARRTSRK